MDRCPFCGAEYRPGENFCLNCGNRIITPPSVKKKSDIVVTVEAEIAREYAVEEAINFQHRTMRIEHFLAGLVREEKERGGDIAEVLEQNRVETSKVREAITFIFGYGQHVIAKKDMHSSPLVEKMLEKASLESKRFRHPQTDTIHILKAIVSETRSPAISIFDLLDVNMVHLQEQVDLLLHQIPPAESLSS